jgi:hypothetical protein
LHLSTRHSIKEWLQITTPTTPQYREKCSRSCREALSARVSAPEFNLKVDAGA